MKNILALIALVSILTACNNKGPSEDLNTDVIEIEEGSNVKEPRFEFKKGKSFDFGKITEGEKVEHTFRFTNTGEDDLLINSCKASCGCTIPNWPKEAIAPGESGEIKVVFNSAGKSGNVSKDITIIANTNPVKTVLVIKVFVDKKETE